MDPIEDDFFELGLGELVEEEKVLTLEDVKRIKLAELKKSKITYQDAPLKIGDYIYGGTSEDVSNYANVLNLLALKGETETTIGVAEGRVTVTVDELGEALNLLGTKRYNGWLTYSELSEAVNNATSISEVNNISWTLTV